MVDLGISGILLQIMRKLDDFRVVLVKDAHDDRAQRTALRYQSNALEEVPSHTPSSTKENRLVSLFTEGF